MQLGVAIIRSLSQISLYGEMEFGYKYDMEGKPPLHFTTFDKEHKQTATTEQNHRSI